MFFQSLGLKIYMTSIDTSSCPLSEPLSILPALLDGPTAKNNKQQQKKTDGKVYICTDDDEVMLYTIHINIYPINQHRLMKCCVCVHRLN